MIIIYSPRCSFDEKFTIYVIYLLFDITYLHYNLYLFYLIYDAIVIMTHLDAEEYAETAVAQWFRAGLQVNRSSERFCTWGMSNTKIHLISQLPALNNAN